MQKRLTYTLAFLLIGGILAACSTPTSPAPVPGTDPALPSDASALVLEAVDSPVYDELAKSVKMVPYDGTQKVEDYDMVIFDGDAHAPEAVRDHPLIRAAMRAHKWVLALDATAEHKQTGLGGYLLAATKGMSAGYLSRIKQDISGHAGTQILELPQTPRSEGDTKAAVQASDSSRDVVAEGTAQFVLNSIDELQSGHFQALQTNSDPPVVPDYVGYYPVSFSRVFPWTPTGAKKANKSGTQSALYQVNYDFEIFLDTRDNDAGSFQWVSVRLDGQATPSTTGKFVNFAHDEKAWFQDQFLLSIEPNAEYDSNFTSQPSYTSPSTLNNSQTVTTGVNFIVGLSKDGPNASFNYNYSKSQTLTDWQVINNSSGNLMSWSYLANNPYDAEGDYHCGEPGHPNNGFDKQCYPETPTNLSQYTLTTTTQGVWTTSTQSSQDNIVEGNVNFDIHSEHHVADPYCASDLGGICASADETGASRENVYWDDTLTINMSAVLPIDKTFTLSSTEVAAGTSVKATITLNSPALRDTLISISGSANASVPDPASVIIPQGGTEASFVVQTNDVGIDPGESSDATVTIYYGAPATATLTVSNPN